MKIAVCIKQVPTLSKIIFNDESKTIVRKDVPLEINSFDLVSLNKSIELKKNGIANVTALTMGPPQAREALVACLALGVDDAILISDSIMAGSDTLATARTLALTLKHQNYDLIFCGRNSTDAETGQVGPEVAEILGIPHISNVRNLDYIAETNAIKVERITDTGYETIECTLPVLVTSTEGLSPERHPRRRELLEASKRPIREISSLELSSDPSIFGAQGSPTLVADIRPIKSMRLANVINEPDPTKAAVLATMNLQDRLHRATKIGDTLWVRYPGQSGKSIWVVVEKVRGGLSHSTLELLGKARAIAKILLSEVTAISIEELTQNEVDTLACYGADRILILQDAVGFHTISPFVAQSFARALKDHNPYAVLISSTSNGRDLASRVAARLGLGLTGDCIDLEIDSDGQLVQLKPALGGNIVAPIISKTRPYMATMRPGMLTPVNPIQGSTATVERVGEPPSKIDALKLLDQQEITDIGFELHRASIVIGIGMGIGNRENLPLIRSLAESIGASLAATRSVTDAGWLPKQLQIGLTGRAIAPKLYIAIGIRGDFNHMVGVQKSGTIVAINSNAQHPIFQAADYGIVGDYISYLPPFIEALTPMVD